MDTLFLKLHREDNVLIAIKNIEPGQTIELEGATCSVPGTIPKYFKIAAKDIDRGQKIMKCGMCIGVATEPIKAGHLVHIHNLKSDYMASFTGNH